MSRRVTPSPNRSRKGIKKTYNTKDSLVVTDPTTSLALAGLSMGERTGSRVSQRVWSYVFVAAAVRAYTPNQGRPRTTPTNGGAIHQYPDTKEDEQLSHSSHSLDTTRKIDETREYLQDREGHTVLFLT